MSFKETQIKQIKEYCGFFGLTIVKTFSIVESAKDSAKRTKLNEANTWADKRNIRHRVYYMSDRESRNLTDLEITEGRIKRDEIVLHYAVDRKQFWCGTADSDFLMREMQGINNKQFSRNLSTKARLAAKSKCEAGWFPGNKPTLGYVQQPFVDENGKELKRGKFIAIDSNERNVEQVKLEFYLRGEKNYTLDQIADVLLEKGFITYRQRRTYISSIDRRLRNPFYSGYFRWPKDGPNYRGKHKLIIDPELFDKVQKTYSGNKLSRIKNGIFSGGFLRCADSSCGCSIVYDPTTKVLKSGVKKTYKLYRCSNGRDVHANLKGRYVNEHQIFNDLSTAFDAIQIDELFAKKISRALNEVKNKMISKQQGEIESYRNGLKDIEVKEDNLIELLQNGTIDEKTYSRQLNKLRAKRDEFTLLLESVNKNITNAGMETVKSTIELAKNAKSLWLKRSPQEKLEFLKMVLSNPVLDVSTVRYDLKKPFATLAKMKGVCDWRSLRESNPCLRHISYCKY